MHLYEGRIRKKFHHLSTSDSQHLTERHDGSSTMKVHEVLQEPVTLILPYYDVMAILQCINHEMSAAVVSAEESVHKSEKERTFELLD